MTHSITCKEFPDVFLLISFLTPILTPPAGVLKPLLDDLAAVFKDADSQDLLSKSLVPTKFHESNPALIAQSYESYIQETPKATKVSVQEKLKKHDYSKPYDLYHDITLVSAHSISQLPVGSTEYNEIDFFYKFTTELTLREVGTLGVKLKEDTPEDELLAILTEDFEKISSSYTVSNGEIVTQVHKYEEVVAPSYHSVYGSQQPPATKTVVQPLFSGLVGRSALDTRNTVVPDPYQLSKVVGTTKVLPGESGPLKAFSGYMSRIPPPTQPPTQVLDSFFHPNWYTIEAPKWLIYKQKTLKPPVDSTLVKNVNSNDLRIFEKQSQCVSFGPLTDLRGSVLSEELKTSVWLNHVGLKRLEEIRRDYLAAKDAKDVSLMDDGVLTPIEEETLPASAIEDAPVASASSETKPKIEKAGEISIDNIARFDPEVCSMLELLKSEKDEFLKSPRDLQRTISLSLVRLNKLRQERYLRPGVTSPSTSELVLYKKIVKLASLLLSSKASELSKLSIRLSKKLPVLINDYHGVLPAPLASKVTTSGKSGRLPGIRGPYKKKNRF